MRRLLLILLAAALLLGGAFVYLAPASLLATRVERATGGTLAARQVEGTVWRGRGVLAAGDTQLPIAWTVDPEPLLHGELRAHIGAFDGVGRLPHADVLAQRDRISLRDVDLTLPLPLAAEALGGRIAQRVGLAAEGDLTIRSTALDWVPPTINGDLRSRLARGPLHVADVAPIDLGDVTATLVASGGVSRARSRTAAAPGHPRRHHRAPGPQRGVALLLTPRRADDATLARALATVGTPEGSGWRVNWQMPPR